jgi:hypothetical protein
LCDLKVFFINKPANFISAWWHWICADISSNVTFHHRANVQKLIQIKNLTSSCLSLEFKETISRFSWCQVEEHTNGSWVTCDMISFINSMEYLHFKIRLLIFKFMFRLVMKPNMINSPLNNIICRHLKIKRLCSPKSWEALVLTNC